MAREGYTEDASMITSICSATRDNRIAQSILLALPTTVIATLTLAYVIFGPPPTDKRPLPLKGDSAE